MLEILFLTSSDKIESILLLVDIWSLPQLELNWERKRKDLSLC